MNVKQFKRASVAFALTLGMMPLLYAATPVTEDPAWYSTISGGVLLNPRDSDSSVQLSKTPVAITLDGLMRFNGGQVLAATIGKQWHTNEDNTDKEPKHRRLEVEYWQGRVERSSFDAGVLHAILDDSVHANALFVNALQRVFSTEKSRWWLGAGLGYARVRMPGASSLDTCACLNSAEGNGLAAQVKLIGERLLSERTALFLQVGYLQVPGSSTKTPNSSASHEKLLSGNVLIGFRIRF